MTADVDALITRLRSVGRAFEGLRWLDDAATTLAAVVAERDAATRQLAEARAAIENAHDLNALDEAALDAAATAVFTLPRPCPPRLHRGCLMADRQDTDGTAFMAIYRQLAAYDHAWLRDHELTAEEQAARDTALAALVSTGGA